MARRYGFPSWACLKRHVEVIERYSRFPDRMTAGEPASLADEFLRLVTAYYADQPERWAEGRRLLAEHPEITAGSVHAAAAAADTTALRRILAADPAAARREGGPFRWPPLFYLAYSRHDPQVAEDAVLTAARLLLDAGADPNAGYLFQGLLTPFTVLTGVFGEGELGPVRQPRHPHSLALARLLLEAGADPNDGQALYNRMFELGNDHLELLFEFGLGAGDGGPWRRRLGDAVDTPAQMLRERSWLNPSTIRLGHRVASRSRSRIRFDVPAATGCVASRCTGLGYVCSPASSPSCAGSWRTGRAYDARVSRKTACSRRSTRAARSPAPSVSAASRCCSIHWRISILGRTCWVAALRRTQSSNDLGSRTEVVIIGSASASASQEPCSISAAKSWCSA